MAEEKNDIEIIKDLFEKVEDKKEYIKQVADEFGLKVTSVRINWFTRFDIPDRYKLKPRLIDFTNKYIEEQSTEVLDKSTEV